MDCLQGPNVRYTSSAVALRGVPCTECRVPKGVSGTNQTGIDCCRAATRAIRACSVRRHLDTTASLYKCSGSACPADGGVLRSLRTKCLVVGTDTLSSFPSIPDLATCSTGLAGGLTDPSHNWRVYHKRCPSGCKYTPLRRTYAAPCGDEAPGKCIQGHVILEIDPPSVKINQVLP